MDAGFLIIKENAFTEKVEKTKTLLDIKEKEQNSLDQISFFDTPGQKLDDEIKQLRGMLKAFEWIENNSMK